MARSGEFSGATHVYGQPLSVVKPPDNDFTKGRYSTDLTRYARDNNLTQEQQDDLQQQIEELYDVWRVARDEDLP